MPGWFNLDEGNQRGTSHNLELDTTKYCLHPKRLSEQGIRSHRAAKVIKAALATRVAKATGLQKSKTSEARAAEATEPPKGLAMLPSDHGSRSHRAA